MSRVLQRGMGAEQVDGGGAVGDLAPDEQLPHVLGQRGPEQLRGHPGELPLRPQDRQREPAAEPGRLRRRDDAVGDDVDRGVGPVVDGGQQRR